MAEHSEEINFTRNPNIFLRHRVVELFGVNSQILDDQEAIVVKLRIVASTLDLIIWQVFAHKFSLGVTAVAVISDSHVSIHTWPEFEYVHFEIITCSEKAQWDKLLNSINGEFLPAHLKYHDLDY